MPRGRKRKSEILGDETANDSSIGPIDEHVGARICARRKLLQLSQKQMAEKLGITFQQIQKYEKGVNRIGAGRLYTIASILGVDIDYFFDGISQGAEAVMLLKAFYSLPAKARTALLMMLTSLKNREDLDNDV